MPPRPVAYTCFKAFRSQIICPPPGKSGASRVDITSKSGSRIKPMVVSQTSFKLKGQIELAIPTAMPVLALTSTVGKVAGSKDGSFMVLS